MQKKMGGKWVVSAVLMVLALCAVTACATRNTTDASGTRVIEGYIVDYDGNRVTIDEVELLTAHNTNRITELGLDTTRDFANGYYIHDDGKNERRTYTLDKNVQVRFAQAGINQSGMNRVDLDQGTNAGITNPVMHEGYTLGGTVGGTLGGVDMLGTRFGKGITANGKTPYFITIKDGYITHIEEVGAFSNFSANGYSYNSLYPATENNLTMAR